MAPAHVFALPADWRYVAGEPAPDEVRIPQVEAESTAIAVGTFVSSKIGTELTLALLCDDTRWAHQLLAHCYGAPVVLALVSPDAAILGYTVNINGEQHIFVSFRLLHIESSTTRHLAFPELNWLLNKNRLEVLCPCFALFLSEELTPRLAQRRTTRERVWWPPYSRAPAPPPVRPYALPLRHRPSAEPVRPPVRPPVLVEWTGEVEHVGDAALAI